ncbi:MAG: class I SAM-dependent methyltransferase [Desulfobulbaceae bacterium]|nr:class I SAM-dependent methyltransferase [Desulfobulbaceae bacterium]
MSGQKVVEREYQHNFSGRGTSMFDVAARQRKAKTMISVLEDYFGCSLNRFDLLNVGGSTGIIDHYLSSHFHQVIGIDIDENAISHAKREFKKENLIFEIGDAMKLRFADNTFDVVIFSQVYEHLPNSQTAINEIHRVLKPSGVCFFAANNRLMWNEPHYNLPLLSVIPRFVAHYYMRVAGRGNHYYEKHFTFWGLKKLVSPFTLIDYTKAIIASPGKYHADYMISSGCKAKLAAFMVNNFYWLFPGYIWILKKEDQ